MLFLQAHASFTSKFHRSCFPSFAKTAHLPKADLVTFWFFSFGSFFVMNRTDQLSCPPVGGLEVRWFPTGYLRRETAGKQQQTLGSSGFPFQSHSFLLGSNNKKDHRKTKHCRRSNKRVLQEQSPGLGRKKRQAPSMGRPSAPRCRAAGASLTALSSWKFGSKMGFLVKPSQNGGTRKKDTATVGRFWSLDKGLGALLRPIHCRSEFLCSFQQARLCIRV